jgi:hypothetical protein
MQRTCLWILSDANPPQENSTEPKSQEEEAPLLFLERKTVRPHFAASWNSMLNPANFSPTFSKAAPWVRIDSAFTRAQQSRQLDNEPNYTRDSAFAAHLLVLFSPGACLTHVVGGGNRYQIL